MRDWYQLGWDDAVARRQMDDSLKQELKDLGYGRELADWYRGVLAGQGSITGETARAQERMEHPARFAGVDFKDSMNGKK